MTNVTKTVLFVSHDGSRTGAPILLMRFLRWFQQNSDIPFQVLLGKSGELSAEFNTIAPTFEFNPSRTKLQKALLRLNFKFDDSTHYQHLRERLRASNIGLIYANTIATGEILEFLSFLKCPVLCHVHELDSVFRLLGRENFNLVKKHASFYIAVSEAVRNYLVQCHMVPPERIRVIHGFIPTMQMPPGARQYTAVREQLRIPGNAKLVCGCGSIEPRKGTDLFIKMAAQLFEKHPNPVHFVWIGGRPDQVRKMRQQTQLLGLKGIVHFVGQQPDVAAFYEASEVLLLPSREDPFPLVMLEAALRGKPIICFDHSGGASEFVKDDAGFVVPDFCVEEMASKLVYLLNAPEACSHMGSTARKRVLAEHTIETGAPSIAALIDQFLSASPYTSEDRVLALSK